MSGQEWAATQAQIDQAFAALKEIVGATADAYIDYIAKGVPPEHALALTAALIASFMPGNRS